MNTAFDRLPWMPDEEDAISLDGLTAAQRRQIQNQALRWKRENRLSSCHRKALQRAREEIDHLLPFISKEDLAAIVEIVSAYAARYQK